MKNKPPPAELSAKKSSDPEFLAHLEENLVLGRKTRAAIVRWQLKQIKIGLDQASLHGYAHHDHSLADVSAGYHKHIQRAVECLGLETALKPHPRYGARLRIFLPD